MIAFAPLLLHAAVLISSKKWGSKYGDQVKRGVQMISTRPGMCNRGGIDHLFLVATPDKGQEDDKQLCCIAVLCGLQGVLQCASGPSHYHSS